MKKLAILICVVMLFNGCKIGLNGASIPAEMKTVSVQLFENNAPLVIPYLSSQFTEDFKTRIRNQSRLSITQNDADAVFTGNISNYEIVPVAIQDNKNPTPGANRLNIRVNVKYTNNLNPKLSFEESFERFEQFKLDGQSIQALEPQLIKKVTAQLTEDIFNRAFANW
ncbi:LptE family protein [Pedobacter sp. MC2016-24]|uniref:LptE family protein n=1 Tax=Pedobacter sp. MC2016-24 TaxID=2780090 RepID=UPI0018812663|nr:LptE family protein [Pedobacter sp. MC2016-24]MBE9598909.1 LptE family protein [Pedobacter sp. MC2016-24]